MSRLARLSPWGRLVALSALLVLGTGIALVIARVATGEERLATYVVRGSVNGVELDLGDGDVVVAGGGNRTDISVERTDRFTFGHPADAVRSVDDGVFRVRSRCPASALPSCSVRYRIVVPDNVPVAVRTDGGTVRFRGYRGSSTVRTRSGDVRVDGFCGFSLQARSDTGDIDASAACAPQQLMLRSTSGDVRAVVPDGRYRVDADSTSGKAVVRGLRAAQEGPFRLDVSSVDGDVTVEGGAVKGPRAARARPARLAGLRLPRGERPDRHPRARRGRRARPRRRPHRDRRRGAPAAPRGRHGLPAPAARGPAARQPAP